MMSFRLVVVILTFTCFLILSSSSVLVQLTHEEEEEAGSFLRFFDLGKPTSDSPSPIEGFLEHDGTLLQVSYPSNWTKESIPFVRYTGLPSVAEVAFYMPNQNVEVVISTEVLGNNVVVLSEYLSEEQVALQNSLVGYKLVDLDQTKLGNNIAERIVYTSTQVEDGVAYAQLKTMELVSIKGGTSYFFVYRADASNYLKYLPVVEKMIESFRFKQLGT
jgi:eukaryotic-like serine/threonine-protein kinase